MGHERDEHAMTELDLYAENDSSLYPQFKSIIANLQRKIASGKYKPALAPKLWLYWYDEAARKYCKEFGGDMRTKFPKDLRVELAERRAEEEYRKIKAGEYR